MKQSVCMCLLYVDIAYLMLGDTIDVHFIFAVVCVSLRSRRLHRRHHSRRMRQLPKKTKWSLPMPVQARQMQKLPFQKRSPKDDSVQT